MIGDPPPTGAASPSACAPSGPGPPRRLAIRPARSRNARGSAGAARWTSLTRSSTCRSTAAASAEKPDGRPRAELVEHALDALRHPPRGNRVGPLFVDEPLRGRVVRAGERGRRRRHIGVAGGLEPVSPEPVDECQREQKQLLPRLGEAAERWRERGQILVLLPADGRRRVAPRRREVRAGIRAPDLDFPLRAAAHRADLAAECRAEPPGLTGGTQWAAHRPSVARRGRGVNPGQAAQPRQCGAIATRPLPRTPTEAAPTPADTVHHHSSRTGGRIYAAESEPSGRIGRLKAQRRRYRSWVLRSAGNLTDQAAVLRMADSLQDREHQLVSRRPRVTRKERQAPWPRMANTSRGWRTSATLS